MDTNLPTIATILHLSYEPRTGTFRTQAGEVLTRFQIGVMWWCRGYHRKFLVDADMLAGWMDAYGEDAYWRAMEAEAEPFSMQQAY